MLCEVEHNLGAVSYSFLVEGCGLQGRRKCIDAVLTMYHESIQASGSTCSICLRLENSECSAKKSEGSADICSFSRLKENATPRIENDTSDRDHH